MKHGFLIAAAALVTTAIVLACSPDPGPFFTPPHAPENERSFRQGKLGLITPALDKTWELLAFRSLSGLPPVEGQSGETGAGEGDDAPTQWVEARRKIKLPLPPNGYQNPFKLSSWGTNVYYLNCLDDSFLTALRTLQDRQGQYHDEAAFEAWVDAQDQVFRNCSEKQPFYPAAAAASAPWLVRADRNYQIAAAHFYAEDFAAAETLFRAISGDATSPWHRIGGYMVARTLLREASLANKPGAADAARLEFARIANDPTAGSLRESARGLVEHLDAVEHPAPTLRKLADEMTAPKATDRFDDALAESRYILLADSFQKAVSQPDIPEPFDWVRTLEAGDAASAAHAVDRWRARKSLPWLTVALIQSSGTDAAAPDLIEAADRVPVKSPAFITVTYNALRLRMERGETEAPRALLNRVLAGESDVPPSARNALRAERMRLATSLDDLLRRAPRSPVRPLPPA